MDEGLVFVILEVFDTGRELLEIGLRGISKTPWGICRLRQKPIPIFHSVPKPTERNNLGKVAGNPNQGLRQDLALIRNRY
jgi:hypothetical protein